VAASSSETFVTTYERTWRHIQDKRDG